MSKNMSSTNKEYEESKKRYEEAAAKFDKASAEATERSKKFDEELKNRDLYKESSTKATAIAKQQAAAQGAQAQKAARQAGMSKAAAAQMGADARAGGYGNAFGQQQGQALNATGQQLGMRANNLNSLNSTQVGAAGQAAGMSNQQIANAMQEGSNRYNRAWGNYGVGSSAIGGILQAFSDENLKDAEMNNDDDKWSNVDAILKKHHKNDYKSLIIKNKDEVTE